MSVKRYFSSLNYRALGITFLCWLVFAGFIDWWVLDRKPGWMELTDLTFRGILIIFGMSLFGMFRKHK